MCPADATLAPQGIWAAERLGIVCSKSQNVHNSFCPSQDFPTCYSSLSPLSSKGDAGKPPTLENHGYHSPSLSFTLPEVFLWRKEYRWNAAGWEVCGLFHHLLVLLYMGKVGSSSSPHFLQEG